MGKKQEYMFIDEKLQPEENLESVIINSSIRVRYEQSVKWYIKAANLHKRMYYIFSILEIIFPSFTIIVNSASEYYQFPYKLLITIFSVLSTIIASILSLFKFHKKWMHYRLIAETLQSEFSLYVENVGKYDVEEKQRDKIFITSIEDIMKNELNDWIEMVKSIDNEEQI